MEELRSKRRPTPRAKDEVEEALARMNSRLKYNPVRRNWWKYLVLFLVVFGILSFFQPAFQQGGINGVSSQIVNLAIQIAISGLVAVLFIYIQFFAISRPRTYWLKPNETGIGFKDYKGNPQVLEMAREVVLLLKGAKEFNEMGGELIRGLLLEGDPGVGKSYLAQAIATEAGIPFGYCSAPSLQSPFLAGGMMSVRALYKKARRLAGEHGACILFLDEIDAIGASRQNQQGMGMGMMGMMGGGAGNGLINELLVQMDPPRMNDSRWIKFLQWLGLPVKGSVKDRPAVLTMGATNLVDTLDKALLRPGRFDRKITVRLPDADGRREIIEYYLDKVNHENIPIQRFVQQTIHYTPVAIKYVINEAVVRAHFDGRDAITYRDLLHAQSMHEVGLRQPIKSMSRKEKHDTAYHEIGHTLAQVALLPNDRVVKVTIVPHGPALGFSQTKPIEETHNIRKEELEARMQVSLGSWAAEEMFLGTTTAGVSGDLANATKMAGAYCGVYGMNGRFSSEMGSAAGSATAEEIDKVLEREYRKVKALLNANRDLCHALAAALLEHEELLGDDVMEIVNQYGIVRPDRSGEGMGFKRYGNGGFASKSKPQPVEDEEVIFAPTGTDGVVYPAAVAYAPNSVQAKASQPSRIVDATPAEVRYVAETPAPVVKSAPSQSAPSDEDELLPRSW